MKQTSQVKCRVYEAAPNPMFSEEMRQLIRFVRTTKPVPCAACKKKTRKHWTSLPIVLLSTRLNSHQLGDPGRMGAKAQHSRPNLVASAGASKQP